MENDFLANVPVEGMNSEETVPDTANTDEKEPVPSAPPAENTDTETPPSSQGGNAEKEVASSPTANTEDENNLPFHKHPRWQQMQDKLKSLESALAEKEQARAQETQPVQAQQQTPQEMPIPAWFTQLYGESPEAWTAYQAHIAEERKTIKEELRRDEETAKHAQESEAQEILTWAQTSLKKVEEKHNLDFTKDPSAKNELLKFATEWLPTDEDGNIDLVKAYDLMQKIKVDDEREKAQARKAIAAKTTSDNRAETNTRDYKTSADFKNKSFHSFGRT